MREAIRESWPTFAAAVVVATMVTMLLALLGNGTPTLIFVFAYTIVGLWGQEVVGRTWGAYAAMQAWMLVNLTLILLGFTMIAILRTQGAT